MNALNEAVHLLRQARQVTVFSGAGISAESGIPTFRDRDGLWAHYPPERFATLPGLAQVAEEDPLALAGFFHALLAPVVQANPNPGHNAVARLEAFFDVTVITQNVDNLHQEAGSSAVYEVHGTLYRVDLATGKTLKHLSKEMLAQMVRRIANFIDAPPPGKDLRTALGAILKPYLDMKTGFGHRPGIVLFGEPPNEPDWSESQQAAEACDLMLLVGTSGEVFPANLLPERVRQRGRPVIGVGPESGRADIWLLGKAGEILPELVAALAD
jgi:NAD-dependent deacetylase